MVVRSLAPLDAYLATFTLTSTLLVIGTVLLYPSRQMLTKKSKIDPRVRAKLELMQCEISLAGS